MLRIGPWYTLVLCKPSGAHLQEVADLMTANKLKAFVEKQFSLQEVV